MAAGSLCVILGAGFLGDDVWSVNPDAVATAGALLAVQGEVGPDRLALAVEGPLAGQLRQIARRAAGPAAAAALAPACPEGAHRAMALDDAARNPADGVMPWPPRTADAGAGPAPEILRAVREFAGLAVPRPLPPDEHPVSLWRLSGDTDELTLMAAAFASPWTSWVTVAGRVYLALDDSSGAPTPPPGAQRIAATVPLGRLRLLGPELPAGARTLDRWQDGQLALCLHGCLAGDAWLARRFDRDPPPG